MRWLGLLTVFVEERGINHQENSGRSITIIKDGGLVAALLVLFYQLFATAYSGVL